MSEKATKYAWACSVLQQAMEAGTYGNLTFSMQNGIISSVKTEITTKAPVDNMGAKP